jgi:Zn-dependent peptidase ImmA (M78 family)
MTSSDIQIDLMELADFGQPVKIAQEIHRQLRSQFGSVPLRMPLAGLAEAVGIVGIKEFDTDSFEGTLVVRDGVGAIGLRRGLRSGRRNFTLGHEIGHFLIPNHRFQSTQFQCATADLRRQRAGGGNWEQRPQLERIEVEANEFSAALLVPLPEFNVERRRLGTGCDVGHIRKLAEAFDVSQEMMANLYVRHADEAVAVVTSHRGVIKRVIPRAGFPYLGLKGGHPIPTNSLTHAFRPTSEADPISDLREMPTHAWLERRGSVTALYEQVFVQEDGWAMTMLVADIEEVDEEDDDSGWNRSIRR